VHSKNGAWVSHDSFNVAIMNTMGPTDIEADDVLEGTLNRELLNKKEEVSRRIGKDFNLQHSMHRKCAAIRAALLDT
jgi:hypothetical protein